MLPSPSIVSRLFETQAETPNALARDLRIRSSPTIINEGQPGGPPLLARLFAWWRVVGLYVDAAWNTGIVARF